ncbi:MAG TPA: ATP-binding protein [Blastocatellia bacterium]|nr:ATP-binding protein [Blastocatellia bacterium]
MSPVQILKLVGFATGAMLHLYIAWLIWSRRLGTQQSQSQPARLITVLNLCLGVWFLGNLFITMHELLLGRERLTFLLRAWDVLATTGVALLPAALLHAHVAVWASLDNYRTLTRRGVRLVGAALYAPMAFLPYAVYRLTTGDYRPFMLKIRVLLIPYAIWYLLVTISSALLDWAIVKKLARDATRERTFFKRLGVLLIFNGALQFYVVAIARSGPNDFLWVTFILLSLLPIFFVAYHVYRYRIVDVAVRDSLVYAVFAMIFIAVYTYGVRRLDEYLVVRFQLPAGVVEVILLLGMVALAGPLVRMIDRAVHQLFTGEIGLYRDVVRQVATGAEGFGELAAFVRYSEETIRRGLELDNVRIITAEAAAPDSHERRLIDKMEAWGAESVETDEDIKALGAAIAYALCREGRIIGLMIIAADPKALTSEKRSVLDVIAGQVAVEVEGCRLVEEKVRLERELAARERLATLGQMAAQVAHEVKNPLSAIKSIAQVMREEEALKDYDRDLELIVSEIDRLNRTVSQLLAFSRPSRADQRPVPLAELLDSSVALITAEAKEQGVAIKTEPADAVTLTGAQAGALREALSNLVINAVQAMGGGGEVTIRAHVEAARRAKQDAARLVLTVTDDGPGIPADAQQKVFEPFYSTKSRGTGLGLAIVQRRAVELGGIVELISPVADGQGTQFRLSVPLAITTSRAL